MKKLIILLLIFLSVSLIWEFSHSALYDWDKAPLRSDDKFYFQRILVSSLGDVLFLSFLFFLISVIHKNLNWTLKLRLIDYLTVTIVGLAISIMIEIRALNEPRWFYNELMPTIFGIGLTPLVQLPASFFISIFVFNKLIKTKSI